MCNKFKATLLIVLVVIGGGSVWGTPMPTAGAQPNYTIEVAKSTEGGFTVTNRAIHVGLPFETTYTMTGTANDFIEARDALTSSMLDDFGKSPTLGT